MMHVLNNGAGDLPSSTMLTKIALLGACAFVALVSSQDYEFEEFERRRNLITNMNDLYEKVLITDVYDHTLRFDLEQQIQSNCGNETEGAGQWILNLLTTNTSDNILRRVYIENYLNISKTKDFFNQASDFLMNAIKMDFWCQAKIGTRTAAASLVDFQKSSQTKLGQIGVSIDRWVNGWEKNLTRDIAEVLTNGNGDARSRRNQIVQILQDKYSYGDWLVAVFEGDRYPTECFERGTFHYASPKIMNRTALVVLSSFNRNVNDRLAREYLRNIRYRKTVSGSCDNLTSQIMNESGFKCGSGEFTFFGVYELKSGSSRYIKATATKSGLLRYRDTVRQGDSASCRYHVIIFA